MLAWTAAHRLTVRGWQRVGSMGLNHGQKLCSVSCAEKWWRGGADRQTRAILYTRLPLHSRPPPHASSPFTRAEHRTQVHVVESIHGRRVGDEQDRETGPRLTNPIPVSITTGLRPYQPRVRAPPIVQVRLHSCGPQLRATRWMR